MHGLFYIYQALKLSSTSRKNTTVGAIVNLMSVDAQKIHDSFYQIHEVWASPLQIAIAMALLWNVLGPSSLAGLALLLILAPINGFYLVKKFTQLQVCTFGKSLYIPDSPSGTNIGLCSNVTMIEK